MDTNNEIKEHSKVKLSIYKKYLEAYLAIMMALPDRRFKDIFVVDVFAGQGKDEHGNKGSALIAANVIKGFHHRKGSKSINLYLNDIDPGNYQKLKENMPTADYNFVNIDNKDANAFIQGFFSNIQKITSPHHSLLFIDSYGYTQIERATYDDIFKRSNLDIFIFIPIFHIYRFLKGDEEDEHLKPIALFLSNFAITRQSVERITTVEEFANKIEQAIKQLTKSDFVYHYTLENTKNRNNKYALFFVTKNILGAEKFLEAVQKIEEEINRQQELFELILPKAEEFIKLITIDILNNQSVYRLGIKNGFLPRQVNAILKELEEASEIVIDGVPPFRRRKGAFYISHKDYKETPKITITPQNRLI